MKIEHNYTKTTSSTKCTNLLYTNPIEHCSIKNSKSVDAEMIAFNTHSQERTNNPSAKPKNFPDQKPSGTVRGNVCYGVREENGIANIYVVNSSTDPTEYLKFCNLAELLVNGTESANMQSEVEKSPIFGEFIDDYELDQDKLAKVKQVFVGKPPSFVNNHLLKEPLSDVYGITSDDYLAFITDLFVALTHNSIKEAQDDEENDGSKKETLQKAIAKVVSDKFIKWQNAFKALLDDEITYQQIDRRDRKSACKNKTFKAGLKHQFSIFLGTLFTAAKLESAFDLHCNPIKWSFERMSPVVKTVVDIKAEAEYPSASDMITLLKKKKNQRETDEARVVFAEKLTKISEKESTDISDANHKKSYNDIVVPAVKIYSEKHFTNKIQRVDTSGIASNLSLLKTLSPNSLFVSVFEILHDEANKALVHKKLDDSDIVIIESDGEDVVLPVINHKCKLTQPPTFSEHCKSINKFNPPVYRYEVHGDFIDFVEGKAMDHIRKFPQMTYADKGIAIWYLLKSNRQRNMFMKHFGKYLNDFSLSNEKEFQNLYVQVARKLFPEQEKTPIDYQNQIRDIDWLAQHSDEDFDELLDRIKECFENAYPGEENSDVNRVGLANAFYSALNDKFYQKFIDEHHYNDFFRKGKINHVVTQLNKKKRMRLEQKKRRENIATPVNRIASKQSSNKQQHWNSNSNRKNNNRSKQGFRLSNSNPVRLKNEDMSNSAGRSANQYQTRSANNRNPKSRDSNGYSQSQGRPNGGNNNGGKPEVSALRKEIIFLTRNKNINPKGGYFIPLDQIESRITERPGFDIRNYVPHKQYQATVQQARVNLAAKKERMEESRRKAVRKRQNRRKSESVQRRKNVVVNRREVNNVASVFRISSEICRHILRMSKGADGDENQVNNKDTDSYKVMIGFKNKSNKTKARSILDSGAGVNLGGLGLYEKIKDFGTFKKVEDMTNVPKLREASSGGLNVIGALWVDIHIGKNTIYKNCRILISDSVPSNFFVLGTEFLTDLKNEFGFLFVPVFHRVDCKNSRSSRITDSCTDQCAVTKNSMVINPTSKENCDIVNFIPNSSSYVRFLEHYDDLVKSDGQETELPMGTYETSKDQALKIRFITDRKINIPPNCMQTVTVKPQEETWCPNNKQFTWTDMEKGEQNILVSAEPTNVLEKTALMSAESEAAVYCISDHAYVIKNHSSKTFQVGKGTAVADCFIIA